MAKISDEFHIFFEENRIWEKSSWLGIPFYKNPCDAIIFQELIYKVKPNLIIETGTGLGGSALFYASIFELMNRRGRVISIDIDQRAFFTCKETDASDTLLSRIRFITGSSTDQDVFNRIIQEINPKEDSRVMVFLDSWHSKEHVSRELELYSPLVTVGSYLVVEDSHIHNPIRWKYGDGPGEAVSEFLMKNDNFVADESCEKFIWTFNPGSWMRRIK